MGKAMSLQELTAVPAPDGRFSERIGHTTYEVAVFFNKRSRMTAEDHVKKLLRK